MGSPRKQNVGSLPSKCMICNHVDVAEINRSLIMMVPVRALEQRFHINKSTISYHSRNHLKRDKILMQAADAVVLDSPENIREQYRWNYNKLKTLHKIAEDSYDTRLQEKTLSSMAAVLDRFAKIYKMWDENVVNLTTNEKKLQVVIEQMSEDELRQFLASQKQPLESLMEEIESTTIEAEVVIEEAEEAEEAIEESETTTELVDDTTDVTVPTPTPTPKPDLKGRYYDEVWEEEDDA